MGMNISPDVTVLGMGEDGHTASLFPDHPSMAEGLATQAPCIAVADSPKPPPERVSLSAALLCASRYLYLHINGESKRRLLEKESTAHPITHILKQANGKTATFWAV